MKDDIEQIELKRNVIGAIKFIDDRRNENLNNFLRIIFILVDFLVDGEYSNQEHDFVSKKNIEIYQRAKAKYSNDCEFLFYTGIMIYTAEWYFDIDNVDEAKIMLENAMKKSPENILFKWGFYTIPDQRTAINNSQKRHLAIQVLNDQLIMNSIKSKGLLGTYIIGLLEATCISTE